MDISIELDGIDFSSDIKGIESLIYIFVRENGFRNSEQIFREYVDVKLSFMGDSFKYIEQIRDSNYCKSINIKIYDTCNGFKDIIFDGTILQRFLTKDIHKCIFTIETLKDNSFSANIRDLIDLEVWLFNTVTIGCSPLSLEIKNITSFSTTIVNIVAWDALDLLNYLAGYLSDNKMTVESDFLTNNKYVITTGYNLHNATGTAEQKYPRISFLKLFTELRKKFPIYMSLEGNVIKVELENTFFTNNEILELSEFSIDVSEQINQDSLFNSIIVGSNNTKLSDNSNLVIEQKSLTAWEKETFLDCGGCGAEKDNDLDLVSDFIIDANMIHEALNEPNGNDYENDSSIFLINYEVLSPTVNGIVGQIGLPPLNYNEAINNQNVLENWVGVLNDCFLLKSFYKYGFEINNNQNINLSLQSHIAGSFFTAVDENIIRFGNPINNVLYDNENSLFNDNIATDPFTYFLCQEFGTYEFYSDAFFIQSINPDDTAVIGAYLAIFLEVYQDATLTTLVDSQIEEVLMSNNLYSVGQKLKIQRAFNLNVGNVVVVKHRFEYDGIGFQQWEINSSQSTFKLIKDSLGCTNLTKDGSEFRPFETELTAILCKQDFENIKANRDGFIYIYGEKCWIKKIEYSPNRVSKLNLIHKKSIKLP